MKKLLIMAAICCFALAGCKKEEITIDPKMPDNPAQAFPDRLFREYVLSNFDTDGNGKISEEEALAVTEIRVYYEYIKSLDGIQYFKNLTSLNCGYNQLTDLDVSKNTKLTLLACGNNQLTNLDLSKNTKLDTLSCYSNSFMNLDVSQNTELIFLACGNNQLTGLDVSKNTKLKELHCSDNKLTSLDVSKNAQLTELDCDHNQIEELDLSKTNLMNSTFNNSVDSYTYPLDCSPMNTLKKVYLKKGWSIKWITDDWNRSSKYIPDHTEIIFVD